MEFPVFQIQEVHYVFSLCWASLSLDLCSLILLPSQVFVQTGKIPQSFPFSKLSNPSCLSASLCITLLQVFKQHHCSELALLQYVPVSCPGEATPAHSTLNLVPTRAEQVTSLDLLGPSFICLFIWHQAFLS